MLQKNRKAIHDNISSKIRLFFQLPDTTVAVTQQFARGIQKQSSDTYNNLKEQKKNGPGSGSGIYFFEVFFFLCPLAFCMPQVIFYIVVFVVSGIL